MLALAAALLVPLSFSDPNGIDPYLSRFAAVSALLLLLAAVIRRLAAARPVLLAVAANVIPFSAWLAVPAVIEAVDPRTSLSYPAQLCIASVVQVLLTLPACWLALHWLRPAERPDLRLRLTRRSLVLTAVGLVLLLLGFLALPAQLLGRVGYEPAEILRDGAWLLPAFLLQGAVQEIGFRSLLLGSLERVMPRGVANLLQACVFGLAHLAIVYEGPLAPFLPLTIALGLIFGWATQTSRSVWPAAVVHALADVLVWVAIISGLYGS